MVKIRTQSEQIRSYILDEVKESPETVAKETAERFGISRQAVNKHLQQLCEEGILEQFGNTRATRYRLTTLSEWTNNYRIGPELAEDVVWAQDVKNQLGPLSDNAENIWHYGFTEMFNNAIDHSEGSIIGVRVTRTIVDAEIQIHDNGCGIFKKIQKALDLLDERHAVLELAKGKLTTDPKHHTGEGIFFTSRMFDEFDILSGGVYFSHEYGDEEDWILERDRDLGETAVFMELKHKTTRTTEEIFKKFMSKEDFGFTKTIVPVRMAKFGEDGLVSRSQAKRLLARVERFQTVLFDFREVDTIGPAFADEIFRVFALRHPEIKLIETKTNSEIDKMISKARNNATTLDAKSDTKSVTPTAD